MAILGALGDLVLALSADTAKFQSDLGKADRMAKKFGQEVGREFGRLANQIAALAGAAGFGALIKSQIDAAEEAGKMAQKLGITTESFSALRHAAHMSDLSIEQFQMGMRKLVTGMADAHRGTGEAKDAFALLGISVTDTEGKLKKGDQALLELAERFSKLNYGTAKADLATRIFGERIGLEMIPFLNMGRDGIEKLKKEAEALGIVFDEKASKEANEFNDNLKTLQGLIKGLAVDIAGPFVEAINKAARAMKEARAAGNTGLIAAFRELFVESDATLAAKEVEEATRIWLKAEDQLQQARHKYEGSFNEHGMLIIADAEDAARRAKLRLQELIKRNRILLGEERFAPAEGPAAGGGKTDVPTFGHSFTPDELKKREDAVLQARIRAFGILEQAGKEADQAELGRYAYVNEQREKGEQATLENIVVLHEQANDRLYEVGIAQRDRMIALKQLELESTGEIEKQAAEDNFQTRLTQINAFTDEELAALGGKNALIEAMQSQHNHTLLMIEKKKHDAVRSMEIGTFQLAAGLLQRFAGESKAAAIAIIAIEKGLAIAQIQMNTAVAVMRAYAELGPVAGSAAAVKIKALGALQTALVVATGLVEIGQLSSGGAAPGVELPPAGGVNVAESAPLGGGPSGPTTVINIHGQDSDQVSVKQVRTLLKSIEEATRGGGRVVVA